MKKNILVTAVGGRSVGSGIVHALTRTTEDVRNRWNVIGSDADSFAWGLYKTPQATLLPLASSPDYIPELKHVLDKFKIDAVIPGSEAEVSVLSRFKSDIPVPVICNSNALMPLMMDKFKMVQKLQEFGLNYIKTYPISEWEEVIAHYPFPFIIKPTTGTGGSKGLHFVFSKAEIENILSRLNSESNYCIQPYIGTGDDEYTVGILSDKNSNIIDSIVMRRKLIGLSLLDSKRQNGISYEVSTGYSQGFFIKHKIIQEYCENLAVRLKSVGPLNIQLRMDGEDIYVFEIHARFSGTSTMRADVGFNEPDILLRNYLFDEKFGRIPYQHDVAVIRAFEHVIVPIDKMIR
ncbi:ATP-grasp domain-containing protein [Daejeonella lutea]|uniref:Carbamoyl-phosphate synthase large subunit n=1 Tax=Daejeonella lutea TaxID=572036 RepID=A0A1T5FCI9_9SPHI|nr:ATP-grasp domain-containing protein [Daejeonella lutea]SKB93798.1 carbamoyl-phosphate synthase large subunit [Daejeonella lutea]